MYAGVAGDRPGSGTVGVRERAQPPDLLCRVSDRVWGPSLSLHCAPFPVVSEVLLVCHDAQIGPSIIKTVSVNVVDYHHVWNFHALSMPVPIYFVAHQISVHVQSAVIVSHLRIRSVPDTRTIPPLPVAKTHQQLHVRSVNLNCFPTSQYNLYMQIGAPPRPGKGREGVREVFVFLAWTLPGHGPILTDAPGKVKPYFSQK